MRQIQYNCNINSNGLDIETKVFHCLFLVNKYTRVMRPIILSTQKNKK